MDGWFWFVYLCHSSYSSGCKQMKTLQDKSKYHARCIYVKSHENALKKTESNNINSATVAVM